MFIVILTFEQLIYIPKVLTICANNTAISISTILFKGKTNILSGNSHMLDITTASVNMYGTRFNEK